MSKGTPEGITVLRNRLQTPVHRGLTQKFNFVNHFVNLNKNCYQTLLKMEFITNKK